MSITFVYRDENNKVQVKKIEYDQGDIKVFHGDDNIVLASWKEPDDVNDHWDDLWEYLNYMAVKYKGYRVGGIQ